MNFKLKALTIVCSLLALPASADIISPTTGNSNVILTIVGGSKSATWDLGITYNDLATIQNRTWNLETGFANGGKINAGDATTVFDNFTSTAQYAVFAADSSATLGAAGVSYYTTAVTAATRTFAPSAANFTSLSYSPTLTNGSLETQLFNMNTYITNNNAEASHNLITDGISLITDTSSTAYGGNSAAYGSGGQIALSGSDSNERIGSYLALVKVSSNNNGSTALATVEKVGTSNLFPTFFLSTAGELVYTGANQVAAVPEADTSMMVLAGLGLIGLISKRRKSLI